MATYPSILAWRIPWTEEPGGLQSMGLQSQTRWSMHTLALSVLEPGMLHILHCSAKPQVENHQCNPDYSLEGLTLKLKLQNFGHLMRRADSLEKTLMLGKTEGKNRRGWQRMRWLDSITISMDMSWSKLQKMVKEGKTAVHGVVF